MARKGKYTDREHDIIDKYKKENQKLKEQISKLRKQISRIDLDRYHNVRDLINHYESTEKNETSPTQEEEIKKLWHCFQCDSDYLRMVTFERRDGIFYYRKCNTCNRKTKLKRLTKDTKLGPAE
jgi:hypothetical protein